MAESPNFWIAAGTIVGIVMLGLHVWQIIFSMSIATRAKRIDTLEQSLANTTRQLIDQQIGGISQAYRVAHEAFANDIKELNDRMRRGDARFAHIEKEKHQLEVDILKQLRDLAEKVATKDDLVRMRNELQRQ